MDVLVARLGLDGFSTANAEADTAKPRSTPKGGPRRRPGHGYRSGSADMRCTYPYVWI